MITKVDKLPYVLYGPPGLLLIVLWTLIFFGSFSCTHSQRFSMNIAGTGKTRTLAALIEQILRLTSHYVLVCAMTNAACDVITDRLLDVLKKGELYRLYNTSCKYRGMNERIKEVSNLNCMILQDFQCQMTIDVFVQFKHCFQTFFSLHNFS